MAPQAGIGVLTRRSKSIWTIVHPIFAIGQLLAFFVSVGFLVAYFLGHVSFNLVQITVLAKIALMFGALITGALWEHDVYGYWWFAPEFLQEDVMTLFVFITQMAYLAAYYSRASSSSAYIILLLLAYAIYFINVAQYIHRTQMMKRDERELKKAA
jgi:3-vinyl bacteriochlorophyllide hydratase